MFHTTIQLQWIGSHFREVCAIGHQAFGMSAWDEIRLRSELKKAKTTAVLAMDLRRNAPAGFAVYETLAPFQFVVLQAAVDREYQRNGIGTMLLNNFTHRCQSARRRKVSLRIGMSLEEHLDSGISFCRATGFAAVGVVKQHGKTFYDFIWQDHPENRPVDHPQLYEKNISLAPCKHKDPMA